VKSQLIWMIANEAYGLVTENVQCCW